MLSKEITKVNNLLNYNMSINKIGSEVTCEENERNKLKHYTDRDSTNKIQIDNEVDTSFCSNCNLTFESLKEYEHHKSAMHSLLVPRKALSCDICSAMFTRQDHLKRHIRSIHSDQRYSKCPVCFQTFERQELLSEHIRTNYALGEHIFNCRDCEYQCRNINELEMHEQKHLLTVRHVCQHCNRSFKRRDHMLRHVKSQHLNQYVTCPICSLKYKRRDHLTRHLKEKHYIAIKGNA